MCSVIASRTATETLIPPPVSRAHLPARRTSARSCLSGQRSSASRIHLYTEIGSRLRCRAAEHRNPVTRRPCLSMRLCPSPVSVAARDFDYLSARWTLSSTPSGQDVPGQKGDDDDRRRDRDDGDGGGGYYHAAILASCPASKPGDERRPARDVHECDQRRATSRSG